MLIYSLWFFLYLYTFQLLIAFKFLLIRDAIEDEDEKILKELALKYKDRAKERREKQKSIENDFTVQMLNRTNETTSNFNISRKMNTNVLSNAKFTTEEESKYLGGDLEHTHLVKGLDYSLLNKVIFA